MIAGAHAVLWVRKDQAGNDACRFANAEGGYLVDGSATDADWNVVRYRIRARSDGSTRRARIGFNSRIFVTRGTDDTWTLNGAPVPAVNGAKDIGLDFSPAALTLPIRRLKLEVGAQADILLAQIVPEPAALRPVAVTLHRTGEKTYTCQNKETGETANLEMDAHGIVRRYEGRWSAQT